MMKQNVEGTVLERCVNNFLSNRNICTKDGQLIVANPDDIGFFAHCLITLWALTSIYPSDRFVRVSWPTQNRWRDRDQSGENLFDLYFDQNQQADLSQLSSLQPVEYHGAYSALQFDRLRPYVQSYFLPS